jgi:Fur family ferric uptake transcriptional regulator
MDVMSSPAPLTLDELLAQVRAGGRRVTVAKRAVARVLLATTGHARADHLISDVHTLAPDVSASTVYRILDEFEELGLVVHAHLGSGAAVYHLAGPVHGHLVCTVCHATTEVPSTVFDSLALDLRHEYGFTLDRHHVALSGVCAACARSATSSRT